MKTGFQRNGGSRHIGGAQKLARRIQTELDDILTGCIAGIFFEFPGQVGAADAGKCGKVFQRQRFVVIIFYVVNQKLQIFWHGNISSGVLDGGDQKMGQHIIEEHGNLPVTVGLGNTVKLQYFFQIVLQIAVDGLGEYGALIRRELCI